MIGAEAKDHCGAKSGRQIYSHREQRLTQSDLYAGISGTFALCPESLILIGLAAKRDEAVRAALAGGAQLEGALLRVASTGALEESREVALAYARSARACLNGELHRDELAALTDAVVNREC